MRSDRDLRACLGQSMLERRFAVANLAKKGVASMVCWESVGSSLLPLALTII